MIYLFTCVNAENESFHFYFENEKIYRFDETNNKIYSWFREFFGKLALTQNHTEVFDIILCIPDVLIIEDVKHIKNNDDAHDYMENYILSKILENII